MSQVSPAIPRIVRAQLESLQMRLRRMEAAIRKHRLNTWGLGEVQHPNDAELYAVLDFEVQDDDR